MNLGFIINRLLQENETVIIPGFGAFISVYTPAQIDEESKQILPPSKEIVFNQQIRNNDGLLVSFIAENERVSHFEALFRMEKERERILYELDKGEKIALENIGILFFDRANKIQFVSFDQENLSLDSFGLKAVAVKEVSADDASLNAEVGSVELQEEKEVEIQKDARLEHVEEFNERGKRELVKENKKSGWLWMFFIVIPLIIVGVYMILNQKKIQENKTDIQTEKTSIQNQSETNDIIDADSISNDTVLITDETVLSEPVDSLSETATQNVSGEKKYYLVGGSFKEKENAEKYLQELRLKGYEPFHLGKKGNFFLVGIKIYNTEREALKEQRLFLENNPGSGAWVYIE